ncbi:MAG: ECF-type sigma factor [Longimicrobiales bacterium]|nr:ECF-type sigma factor [Longimicrobiales bacterium]
MCSPPDGQSDADFRSAPGDITRLLAEVGRGDETARDQLVVRVYGTLKRLARSALDREWGGTAISSTELVHEAYLKLLPHGAGGMQDRVHFFGSAARAMRQVLVDHARRSAAAKRGGGWSRATLGPSALAVQVSHDELLDLDRALEALQDVSERLHRVVELRYFAGLTDSEIAEVLGLSTRTVERDWLKARLILLRTMRPDAAGADEGGVP